MPTSSMPLMSDDVAGLRPRSTGLRSRPSNTSTWLTLALTGVLSGRADSDLLRRRMRPRRMRPMPIRPT